VGEEFFMESALDEARKAFDEGEIPVGCVIVKDGKIIARGRNMRENLNDPTAHAEIIAIREAAKEGWRLNECEIYVTLEPCPMCAGAISQARLKRLVFGAYDKKYGCAGSVYRICEDPAFGWYCKSEGGILREKCAALIDTFFQNRRKK